MLYLACLLKQLTSLCSYRYKQKIAHSTNREKLLTQMGFTHRQTHKDKEKEIETERDR